MPLVYMSQKAIYSEKLTGQSFFSDFLMNVHVAPKHDPWSGHIASVIHIKKKATPPFAFPFLSEV